MIVLHLIISKFHRKIYKPPLLNTLVPKGQEVDIMEECVVCKKQLSSTYFKLSDGRKACSGICSMRWENAQKTNV